jgi:hypothetical protein
MGGGGGQKKKKKIKGREIPNKKISCKEKGK